MKKLQLINLDKIISVSLFEERDANFIWQKAEPIKKFFNLINTGKFTKEGWRDMDSLSDVYFLDSLSDKAVYTKEELKSYNYNVYDYRVCYKPYINIILCDKNSITWRFDTNESANIALTNLVNLCEAKNIKLVTQ
jgi:hypothetical protein